MPSSVTRQSNRTPGSTILVDLSLEITKGTLLAKDVSASAPHPLIAPLAAKEESVEQGFDVAPDLLAHADNVITTRVDGLDHFKIGIDRMSLHWFRAKAVCLDLRHIPDLGDIDVPDLEKAESESGVRIDGHIVLMCTGFHARHWPHPEVATKNPGLTAAATHWLADRGSRAHGVEGPSTDKAGTPTFPSHRVCRERDLFHYEWLVQLESLLGKGEFMFIGYPVKGAHRTLLPVRAVAELGPYRMLWLYTIGRQTGAVRKVELNYADDGENLVIVGSNQGSDKPPAWIVNLQANPHAEVQVGHRRWPVVARVVTDEQEYARLWKKALKEWGDYDEYQRRTRRKLPILVLEKSSQWSGFSAESLAKAPL